MTACVYLIIGEGEGEIDREREREQALRDKRSVDRLIQSNLQPAHAPAHPDRISHG